MPQSVLDAAPEVPTSLEPEMFRWSAEEDAKRPVRPARLRALEALPDGGSVLDVGVGGGAGSLPLAPPAGLIVGVDTSQPMLDLFEATGRQVGVATRGVLGAWPDVADRVDVADVAVCYHAVYGVVEIEAFVEALTAHARRRVVVELTVDPPLVRFDPLMKAFHGVERPPWRVADGLHDVLLTMGVAVEREDIVPPPRKQDLSPAFVTFVRRRLFVGAERDGEVEDFLRSIEQWTQTQVALWWPGSG